VDLFLDAMHRMFWLMAVLSVVAAIPSALRGAKYVHKSSLGELSQVA